MSKSDDDELSAALSEVAAVLDHCHERGDLVTARSRELLAGRAAGLSYAELMTGASGPLVLDVLSDLYDALAKASSRLRRVEVRALHAEGLSMDKIARLLRVSRQRVSAILNASEGHDDRPADGSARTRAAGLSLTDSEFRLIAEALPHLVWVTSPEGLPLYFNHQATDYAGIPREGNQDRRWLSFVHPDDREQAMAAWWHAMGSEEEFELNYRLRRFDGLFRWHRARSLPVRGTDGQIVKWIGTATDIDDLVTPS